MPAGRPDIFSDLESRGEPSFEPAPAPSDDDSGHGEMVPRSLLNEERDRRKELERMQDQFLISAMRGTPQQQAPANQGQQQVAGNSPPEQDLSFLEGLEPEVASGIREYLTHSNQQFANQLMQQLEQRFGPALEQAVQISQEREVETTIPGFKDVEDRVAEAFRSLPPTRQEEYDNRLGVEALTLKVQLEEATRQLQELAGGTSPHAGRAAMTPAHRGSGMPTDQAAEGPDPWDLSDEDFEKFKRSQGL